MGFLEGLFHKEKKAISQEQETVEELKAKLKYFEETVCTSSEMIQRHKAGLQKAISAKKVSEVILERDELKRQLEEIRGEEEL